MLLRYELINQTYSSFNLYDIIQTLYKNDKKTKLPILVEDSPFTYYSRILVKPFQHLTLDYKVSVLSDYYGIGYMDSTFVNDSQDFPNVAFLSPLFIDKITFKDIQLPIVLEADSQIKSLQEQIKKDPDTILTFEIDTSKITGINEIIESFQKLGFTVEFDSVDLYHHAPFLAILVNYFQTEGPVHARHHEVYLTTDNDNLQFDDAKPLAIRFCDHWGREEQTDVYDIFEKYNLEPKIVYDSFDKAYKAYFYLNFPIIKELCKKVETLKDNFVSKMANDIASQLSALSGQNVNPESIKNELKNKLRLLNQIVFGIVLTYKVNALGQKFKLSFPIYTGIIFNCPSESSSAGIETDFLGVLRVFENEKVLDLLPDSITIEKAGGREYLQTFTLVNPMYQKVKLKKIEIVDIPDGVRLSNVYLLNQTQQYLPDYTSDSSIVFDLSEQDVYVNSTLFGTIFYHIQANQTVKDKKIRLILTFEHPTEHTDFTEVQTVYYQKIETFDIPKVNLYVESRADTLIEGGNYTFTLTWIKLNDYPVKIKDLQILLVDKVNKKLYLDRTDYYIDSTILDGYRGVNVVSVYVKDPLVNGRAGTLKFVFTIVPVIDGKEVNELETKVELPNVLSGVIEAPSISISKIPNVPLVETLKNDKLSVLLEIQANNCAVEDIEIETVECLYGDKTILEEGVDYIVDKRYLPITGYFQLPIEFHNHGSFAKYLLRLKLKTNSRILPDATYDFYYAMYDYSLKNILLWNPDNFNVENQVFFIAGNRLKPKNVVLEIKNISSDKPLHITGLDVWFLKDKYGNPNVEVEILDDNLKNLSDLNPLVIQPGQIIRIPIRVLPLDYGHLFGFLQVKTVEFNDKLLPISIFSNSIPENVLVFKREELVKIISPIGKLSYSYITFKNLGDDVAVLDNTVVGLSNEEFFAPYVAIIPPKTYQKMPIGFYPVSIGYKEGYLYTEVRNETEVYKIFEQAGLINVVQFRPKSMFTKLIGMALYPKITLDKEPDIAVFTPLSEEEIEKSQYKYIRLTNVYIQNLSDTAKLIGLDYDDEFKEHFVVPITDKYIGKLIEPLEKLPMSFAIDIFKFRKYYQTLANKDDILDYYDKIILKFADIKTGDIFELPILFKVSKITEQPRFDFDRELLDFGYRTISTYSAENVRLYNLSSKVWRLRIRYINSSEDISLNTLDNFEFNLLPTEYFEFPVAFAPLAVQEYTGEVIVDLFDVETEQWIEAKRLPIRGVGTSRIIPYIKLSEKLQKIQNQINQLQKVMQ